MNIKLIYTYFEMNIESTTMSLPQCDSICLNRVKDTFKFIGIKVNYGNSQNITFSDISTVFYR